MKASTFKGHFKKLTRTQQKKVLDDMDRDFDKMKKTLTDAQIDALVILNEWCKDFYEDEG